MPRTRALGILILAVAALAAPLALWWNRSGTTLNCAASDVRWVDAGSAWIAHCAPGTPPSPLPAGVALTLGLKLDLNQASEEDLQLLPGIGPALAKDLVQHRPFRSWTEVRRLRGIGPAKLEVLQSALEIH